MSRLSVAIWPPAEVDASLSLLDRPARPGVRWSTPDQWMVKVRPLGHVDEHLVPALVDALNTSLAGRPSIRCVLGPATRRLGGQWLGAPVAGLDELADVVFEATSPIVPVTHPQPFQADIILARGRVPAGLAGQPVSATWTAAEVALVADRSSPRMARFEDLALFPLAG